MQMEIPKGYYGRVWPRLSLTLKNFLDISGGVINSDFREDLLLITFTHSKHPFEVKIGDKIAQFVFQKWEIPIFIESKPDLSKTLILFSCKSNKMSHVKAVVCNHVSVEFNELNRRSILTCLEIFRYKCTDTYGGHKVFACLCNECTNVLMRNECLRSEWANGDFLNCLKKIELFNHWWTKFCFYISSFSKLIFKGNMRLYQLDEMLLWGHLPIFFSFSQNKLIKLNLE